MTRMPITLVLADDHPIVLEGLQQLLSLESDFAILAKCRQGEAALATVRRHRPDILVLDLQMPGKDGLTVLRELHAEQLPTRVVVLTAALDADDALEAVRLGVKGLMLKDMAPQLLVQCIREVAAGGEGFDRGAVTKAMEKLLRREAMAEATASLLSARELEIARMVARGRHNKEIARELGVAEATIKAHLYNAYQKVGVANRVGLTLWVQERQLV